MPKPDGPQFKTLYRGLHDVSHPDELDPELVGPHWTPSKSIAALYAGKHGSIITGQVPTEHILLDDETNDMSPDLDKYTYDEGNLIYRVMPYENEGETFVRPGVPIRVTGMETHRDNPIRDKWSFNPPMIRSSEKLYSVTKNHKGNDVVVGKDGQEIG